MTGRASMEARLRERAQREPEFRARLLDDPRAAVGEALGIELGEIAIRVVEEQPGEVVLVLPPHTPGGADMSDADLAHVAGGGWLSGGPSKAMPTPVNGQVTD